MARSNIFILAADNNPELIPLLRSDPALASAQDSHGYSLLHAAVSYNHLDLVKNLVKNYRVDVNITDEDHETPLFVAETVEAAQILTECLGADVTIPNVEGETAEEKILSEGEHPKIAAFLKECRLRGGSDHIQAATTSSASNNPLNSPKPLPPNVTFQLGTIDDDQSIQNPNEVDQVFRQRIEELASRDDFQGEAGQQQLRELIKDAVISVGSDGNDRDVRRRLH